MNTNTLMTWASDLPHGHQTCLECGAGRGEISVFMAQRFSHVIALDLSLRHLRSITHPVMPMCATAEALPFADKSMDFVVSMQALHHFAVAPFLAEAHRVLRRGGIFAAFCWGEVQLPLDVKKAYACVFKAIQPYWEHARTWVMRGYAGVEFDGASIEVPLAQMTCYLTIEEFEKHIMGWSAMQRACASGVEIPDPEYSKLLLNPQARFPITWPLLGKVFRV